MPHYTYTYQDHSQPVTVVFSNALGMQQSLWQDQVESLEDYNSLTVDLMQDAHGDSFSLRQAAADIADILKQESIDRFVMVGLSLGAYIIQEFADRFGGAEGYVFVGATPKFAPCYASWEIAALMFSNLYMPIYANPYYSYHGAFLSTRTVDGYNKAKNMLKVSHLHGLRQWFELTDFYDPKTVDFKAPILACCGDNDYFGTNLLHLFDWERSYENVTTKIIQNAGHLANLDQPESFNALLKDFLARCTNKSAICSY